MKNMALSLRRLMSVLLALLYSIQGSGNNLKKFMLSFHDMFQLCRLCFFLIKKFQESSVPTNIFVSQHPTPSHHLSTGDLRAPLLKISLSPALEASLILPLHSDSSAFLLRKDQCDHLAPTFLPQIRERLNGSQTQFSHL